MKLAVVSLLILSSMVGASLADGDLDDASDRLDDFSDISMDDESNTAADMSHLSDDEFLAGEGDVHGQRVGEHPGSAASADKSALMMRVMANALKKPGMTERFGQVLPILRVMSPPQRLALVSLVLQQAMTPKDSNEPPVEMAMRLGATPDGRSNLTSQLLLPLSSDMAHIFRGEGLEGAPQGPGQGRSAGGQGPQYRPPPQLPRWRGPPPGAAPGMPPPLHGPRPAPPAASDGPQSQWPQRRHGEAPPPAGINRRNVHVPPSIDMRPPPLPGRTSPTSPTTLKPFSPTSAVPAALPDRTDLHGCSLFSDTVCESVDRYPEEAILASILADRHTADALLADKTPPGGRSVSLTGPHQPPVQMQRRQDDDYPSESAQELDGQDDVDDSLMCASIVKYARPQRARATSGQWKYIVNTAEHTQTLRLEKCKGVDEPCHYLPDKMRSHCVQVYNYHRLLTWDKQLGLHMDIFKVPTCCSCQVQKSPFIRSNSVPRPPSHSLGSGGGAPFVPHQPVPSYQQQQQHHQQQQQYPAQQYQQQQYQQPQYKQAPYQQPQQHLQPIAEYSQTHETVVSESGRPVQLQYTLKPYSQQVEESRRDTASKSTSSSRPSWPFRKAATRRPPVQTSQGQGHGGPLYGIQTIEENPAPGDHLPQYPPLHGHKDYDYPPPAGRRTSFVRNRTRVSAGAEDDLEAEGSQRRPVPVLLTPEGNAVRVPAPPAATATSKRPPPPVLPPRLETYRPRPATTPASRAPTTAAASPTAPVIISTTTPAPSAPVTPAPKRVNYSYHPIIDFFRPLEKQMAAQEPRSGRPGPPAASQPHKQALAKDVSEQRKAPDDGPGPTWSAQQSDWSPITSGKTSA